MSALLFCQMEARRLPAHLWSLIGRLILVLWARPPAANTKLTGGKMPHGSQTLGRPQCGFVARCPRWSPDSVRNGPLCVLAAWILNGGEDENLPPTVCREKPWVTVLSFRATLLASAFPQSFFEPSPHSLFAQDRTSSSGNVSRVYSGRAATGHHTCGSTQYNLWYGVVLSQHDCNLIEARTNISFALLMLLSCVPGSSGVSCGTVAWLPEVAIDVTSRTHSLLDGAGADSVTTTELW